MTSETITPRSQQMSVLDMVKWEWFGRWVLFFRISFFDSFGWPVIPGIGKIREFVQIPFHVAALSRMNWFPPGKEGEGQSPDGWSHRNVTVPDIPGNWGGVKCDWDTGSQGHPRRKSQESALVPDHVRLWKSRWYLDLTLCVWALKVFFGVVSGYNLWSNTAQRLEEGVTRIRCFLQESL